MKEIDVNAVQQAPDPQPMIISIPSSAKWTARLFFALIVLGLSTLVLLGASATKMSWMELSALGAATMIVLGGTVFWSNLYLRRLVIWAEFGDCFRFRTKTCERQVPWSEVSRFVLGHPDSPLSGLSIVDVMLTDGTKLAIWTKTTQAEAALDLVRNKAWARNWQGRPLESGIGLVMVLLGLIALLAGLLAGYWLLVWYSAPQQGEFPMNVRLQIMAVIVGPLLGAGAIGFGIYQMIRRPIYYRSAVMRSAEMMSGGPWQRIKKLFWPPE